MRRIEHHEPQTRIWRRWCQDCRRATVSLLASVAAGDEPELNSQLYNRRSIKASYFFGQEGPFYGKCAYCETAVSGSQHGDIDHFRPKGAVTDENDVPIHLKDVSGKSILQDDGTPRPHPGYYWLAYDWENLLPACTICNQPSSLSGQKIGKHSRFPVIGQHAQTPAEIGDEQPLLINPTSSNADDAPDQHLTVDPSTGLMGHRTERGEMCLKVFGLNLRDELVEGRLRAGREVKLLLVQLITNPESSDTIKAELIAIRDGKRPYTMAARAVLDELASTFASVLEPTPSETADAPN